MTVVFLVAAGLVSLAIGASTGLLIFLGLLGWLLPDEEESVRQES